MNVGIGLLIQLGAVSFMVGEEVYQKRKWSRLSVDTRLVLLVHAVLVAGGATVFLIAEWSASLASTPVADRPMSALFQSVAARSGG